MSRLTQDGDGKASSPFPASLTNVRSTRTNITDTLFFSEYKK